MSWNRKSSALAGKKIQAFGAHSHYYVFVLRTTSYKVRNQARGPPYTHHTPLRSAPRSDADPTESFERESLVFFGFSLVNDSLSEAFVLGSPHRSVARQLASHRHIGQGRSESRLGSVEFSAPSPVYGAPFALLLLAPPQRFSAKLLRPRSLLWHHLWLLDGSRGKKGEGGEEEHHDISSRTKKNHNRVLDPHLFEVKK